MITIRKLTEHKVNPANDVLDLYSVDILGPGNAYHNYNINFPNGDIEKIKFQNGPINEVGVNGLTHEVLLAIIADRLRCFQSGPYACRENEKALEKIEEAMQWMHSRTLKRMQRGVEGTHKV